MSAAEAKPAEKDKEKSEHVDALEEDDEFEEFEQQEWTAAEQDSEDTTMWQDGWEDDEEDDQFTKQLRAELSKTDAAAPAAMQS